MTIEHSVRARLESLISDATRLRRSPSSEVEAISEEQKQQCGAWLAAAQNAVHLIIESPLSPYRKRTDSIADRDYGWITNQAVGELSEILQSLIRDADAGLLTSVADRARAETFDDFLDHAEAYLADKRKNEAGVIAGVVFEDTVRRICRKEGITEKGVKLDGLISELTKRGELSAVKAKRARVSADVRTKASHAQWDEFEVDDVQVTIEFTRSLIGSKLDG